MPGRYGNNSGRGGRGQPPRRDAVSFINKFHPQGEKSDKPYATFETVKEKMLDSMRESIRNNARDTVQSIDKGSKVDLAAGRPQKKDFKSKLTIRVDILTGKEHPKDREEYDDDEKGEMERLKLAHKYHRQREADLDENLYAAYSTVLTKHCSEAMQRRVKEHPKFKSEIQDDVFKLMEVILVLMQEPVGTRHPVLSLVEALGRWVNLRQKGNEELHTYVQRFKQERNIVATMMGTKCLDGFVQQLPEYKDGTATEQQELEENAFGHLEAMILLRGADMARYSDMWKRYAESYGQERDYYPRDLQGAHNALLTAKLTKKTPRNEAPTRTETSFAQTGARGTSNTDRVAIRGRCICCGDQQCWSNRCPVKSRVARDEWFDRTGNTHSHLQANETPDEDEDDGDDGSVRTGATAASGVGFSGFQHSTELHSTTDRETELHSTTDRETPSTAQLQNLFILDTGTTKHSLCNANLGFNKKKSLIATQINTNVGTRVLDEEISMLRLQAAASYNPDGIANVIGFAPLVDQGCRLIIDTAKEDAFYVQFPDGKWIKFPRRGQLYVAPPTDDFLEKTRKKQQEHETTMDPVVVPLLNQTMTPSTVLEADKSPPTLAKAMEGYTAREVERARAARKLYHDMSAPSVESFKLLIQNRKLDDCSITVTDVTRAEKIFGPSISALKGKTTKKKSEVIIGDDFVPAPLQILLRNQNLELAIDIVHICGIPFLTSIDLSIKFRAVVPLNGRSAAELHRGTSMVINHYNKANFGVRRLRADNEFAPSKLELETLLKIALNCCNPDEHVPQAERNNRVLEEGVRTGLHRMPFRIIPRVMIRHLTMKVAHDKNVFVPRGGVSEILSPQELVSQRRLSVSKHFAYSIGSYVQATQKHEPRNDNLARTLDAIYLRPSHDRLQLGHYVMCLSSGRAVIRSQIACALPMTPRVIQIVEGMATKQGITEYKATDRTNKRPFLDLDLAGVEDESDDDDSDYEDDSDDDSSDDGGDFDALEEDEVDRLTGNLAEDEEAILLNNNQEGTNDVPTTRTGPESIQDQDDNVAVETVDSEDEDEYIADEVLQHQDEEIDFQVDPDEVDADAGTEEAPSATRSGRPVRNADAGTEETPSATRSGRPVRIRTQTRLLDPSMEGKSHSEKETSSFLQAERVKQIDNPKMSKKESAANKRRVRFADDGVKKGKADALEMVHNLLTQAVPVENQMVYERDLAKVVATNLLEIRRKCLQQDFSMMQMYYGKAGLNKFGESGKKACFKELGQMMDRVCYTPILPKDLTAEEKRKVVDGIMIMNMKRDESIKSRLVYNGKSTREWISNEDKSSPTASNEALFLTAVLDAHEECDVMTNDVPNAFIQAVIENNGDRGNDKIVMKLTGVVVDLLIEMAPEVYKDFVVLENGKKVLYVHVLRNLYGMLDASLRWYSKFRNDLETHGFRFSAYDPCVAVRDVAGSQHRIRFHVDDLMSSHKLPKVNDKFHKWLNKSYGKLGEVKTTRGKVHDFLGMKFDFRERGKVRIDMADYILKMLEESPIKLSRSDTAMTPASNGLLQQGNSKTLDKRRAKAFHTTVAQGLFVSKRGRPDIQPTVAVLCTRVQDPTESDWDKLVRLLRYLNGTRKKTLVLSADNLRVLKWFVDVSFGVHPDFKSHTGSVLTMGSGAIQSQSMKQKVNSRSTCEAELIGTDDALTQILWTKLFLEDLGYPVEKNILYQDNQSAILLEVNGRKSIGKRSRHLSIRYFFLTDQVQQGKVSVEYCPTDKMIADYMTKPLQGAKFTEFRRAILGE